VESDYYSLTPLRQPAQNLTMFPGLMMTIAQCYTPLISVLITSVQHQGLIKCLREMVPCKSRSDPHVVALMIADFVDRCKTTWSFLLRPTSVTITKVVTPSPTRQEQAGRGNSG
jgi:hypothetical protein